MGNSGLIGFRDDGNRGAGGVGGCRGMEAGARVWLHSLNPITLNL